MIEVANNAAVVALASQAAVISAFSRARTALCLQTFQFRWRAGLHFLLGVCAYLNGHSVAALGGDDAVVSIVVDLVVVDSQEVAVVVGVEAVLCVVVHLVPSPVSLLVAVRVDPEMVVVDVRVVNVAVDVDLVEYLGVTEVLAEPSNLLIYSSSMSFWDGLGLLSRTRIGGEHDDF